MSGITCDQLRTAALDPGTASPEWLRRPDIAAHLQRCPACQDWLDAFATGARLWTSVAGQDLTDQVIARTSGLDAVVRDLPLLAELDPGPGFTERVLMATSGKTAPEGWRVRAAAAWRALVGRPRFAWEAAYVATVCWVLVFGNPVGAFDWGAANIGAVARERLGPPVQELRGDLETWRARFAPGPTEARAAAAAGTPEAEPPIVRAWQAATDWLHGTAALVADVFKAAWDRVAAWVSELASGSAPPPTEPPLDPARSPQ